MPGSISSKRRLWIVSCQSCPGLALLAGKSTDIERVIVDVEPVEVEEEPLYFGQFQPGGRGFKLADTPWGDVNFSAWTYVRYLNQQGLDDTYTDAFGAHPTYRPPQRSAGQQGQSLLQGLGLRSAASLPAVYLDVQHEPGRSPPRSWWPGIWATAFNELDVGLGIGALPGTRTLRGTFPYWNKVDNRPIADEFFRPSYTTGIWAGGRLAEGLKYKVMVGNNLSQLGVDAVQLDDGFKTGSGDLVDADDRRVRSASLTAITIPRGARDDARRPVHAQPRGPAEPAGPGRSRQPPDPFVRRHGDFLAGRVRHGRPNQQGDVPHDVGRCRREVPRLALEGEYYFRWVDDFETEGAPDDELFDHGFQVQASTMLRAAKPSRPIVAGSMIFGEYGDPWDASLWAELVSAQAASVPAHHRGALSRRLAGRLFERAVRGRGQGPGVLLEPRADF